MSKRIIYYYQTFSTLRPILDHPTCCGVTHIHLSAFHFGTNKDGSPYIHMNNYPPQDKQFVDVWKEIEEAHNKGIKIVLMLGGAGGAFEVLFSNYIVYSILLLQTFRNYPCIGGIDLDIEEEVQLDDVKKLIRLIRNEMGDSFIISMAPVQSSLESDEPGMGGFSYKDLYNSEEGKEINYFNGQFYYDYSEKAYDKCITNGYPANKVVMGMIYSEDLSNALHTMLCCTNKYNNFGGAFCWEYIHAPPQGNHDPSQWALLVDSIFHPKYGSYKTTWYNWFSTMLYYLMPWKWKWNIYA